MGNYVLEKYEADYHSYMRNPDGDYITIDPPGSYRSVASDINDSGQIVGWYEDNGGNRYGFLRNPNGGYVTIDPPGAITDFSEAVGINDAGQIVGWYETHWDIKHGFLRNPNGSYITIDLPGIIDNELNDINDAGQIVGSYWDGSVSSRYFLRNPDGSYITIAPSGSLESYASGINNSGQIVGGYGDGTEWHGYLRNPNGSYVTIDPPGSVDSGASDINNSGQIVGEYTDGTWDHSFLADPPKLNLFVTIPGINDGGLTMLTRAANMVNDDLECTVTISEVNGLSEAQVRQVITDITKKAKKKEKDVIVNIDMNLENFIWEFALPPLINPWNYSVRWAGGMANIVSDAFTKEVPGGKRILYAHSAGGDATFQTILQAPRVKEKRKWKWKRMYDDINILNGRTKASNLKNVLKSGGYGWWQVKVFTNNGDLPASPDLPLPKPLKKLLGKLLSGSISNYDAAKSYTSGAWVHLHCCDITGHSGLRDAISLPGVPFRGTFEVNLMPSSGTPNCTVVSTVEDMMTRNWR